MAGSDKWDSRYRSSSEPGSAAKVLLDFQHLLPARGIALDLACGLGANGLFLAERGLEVHAWDSSAIALEKLNDFAAQHEILIQTQQRDVSLDPPEENRFDVIVVSHFLDRLLCPAIARSLRPEGLLFYQTFNRNKVDSVGPSNPDYLLEENELLRLFPRLILRGYREDSGFGDTDLRNQAYLVAEKSSAVVTDDASPQEGPS
ncbi:MAG: class I SAM-dependent methyltransferase [Pseudomonadales bacterium]|jgi:SAM-dependent methyltransferase|nr:class I SAM-dependent methyltransferase [Pseudomonadales bacterium]MDP7146915.1 class I SAM-dependent methyltransferase [Pseudomonadales bacterium]MDP7360921.1 class I SAM-dependent methyltransferase [Pseudomonadales bacterium]HJN52070.1 class I SAM-dependent methyltransferase [Pseudomonadales bacterium]|tara:strand:+ start:2612 stop:3220 length:609 start_codon:yes stop_codon:yes gene_type:complete